MASVRLATYILAAGVGRGHDQPVPNHGDGARLVHIDHGPSHMLREVLLRVGAAVHAVGTLLCDLDCGAANAARDRPETQAPSV